MKTSFSDLNICGMIYSRTLPRSMPDFKVKINSNVKLSERGRGIKQIPLTLGSKFAHFFSSSQKFTYQSILSYYTAFATTNLNIRQTSVKWYHRGHLNFKAKCKFRFHFIFSLFFMKEGMVSDWYPESDFTRCYKQDRETVLYSDINNFLLQHKNQTLSS